MRLLLSLGIALLLGACAGLPTEPPAADPENAWQLHEAAVSRLGAWQLTGRLAIQTEDEGWHATVDWRQDHQHYDIRIIGPLGQGSVRLEGGDAYVALSDDGGGMVVSDDAEALLYEQTGWRVPVPALRYWVLGLPAPGTVARRELDPFGRLAFLEQGGWRIEFLNYIPQGEFELPRRVFVTDHNARVRLVVSQWRLPQGG